MSGLRTIERDRGKGLAPEGDSAPLAPVVLRWLESQSDAMLSLLEELVLLESPSHDAQAQQPVLDRLAEALEGSGLTIRRFRGKSTGGYLLGRSSRTTGTPGQLLLGHCDTVWPHGTLESMPWRVEGTVVRGPGIYDMKGGLVQGIFALRALRELGLEPAVAPYFLINSDEEIGSRESRRAIERLARSMDRVLVLEPSLGREGRLKTARKGVGRFTVRVQGKAAHAGLDPERGASAILELSFAIQKLFALNDPEHGTTVNVGQVDGGLRPNVVAPESKAEVDVRVLTREDARRVEAEILAMEAQTPGVQLKVEGGVDRPPLEPTARNRVLWRRARSLAGDLGIELQEGTAGGGSDGNYTSLFTATLDGLGAVGDGAHATNEFIDRQRMVERTALLALLLLTPPVDPSELAPEDRS
ncbi:MAG: M20 family metallopeptidase [Acidobacteriota bacterium]|nr:M20 family metallopeptidase [Acidobacteriota bacterium]